MVVFLYVQAHALVCWEVVGQSLCVPVHAEKGQHASNAPVFKNAVVHMLLLFLLKTRILNLCFLRTSKDSMLLCRLLLTSHLGETRCLVLPLQYLSSLERIASILQ